jgi:4-amino-4-deoxychorismate lyase
MYRLVETIRSENGILNNLEFHNERMMRTLSDLFGLNKVIDLGRIIFVPGHALNGIFKCRVEYDHDIRKTEFIRYSQKNVRSLKAVEDNTIEYCFKFTDRKVIEKLLVKREECDDILIIKNGFITDTSYANVILRDKSGVWYTPSTYLLPGTRRASLLRQGRIREAEIRYTDIENYTEIKLINAMLGLEDTEGISVRNIIR